MCLLRQNLLIYYSLSGTIHLCRIPMTRCLTRGAVLPVVALVPVSDTHFPNIACEEPGMFIVAP